jgi:NB-ARC domain
LEIIGDITMTMRASASGQERIRIAIAAKQWQRSEQDTRPLICASLQWINQYQESQQLTDNDPQWLRDFEQIFRLPRTRDESQEDYQNRINTVKIEVGRNGNLLQKIKQKITNDEMYVKGISYRTWLNFSSRIAINENIFIIYCHILGLNWQEIQENSPESPPPPANLSLESNLDEVPIKPIFYGLQNQLNDLIISLTNEQTQIILISGITGIGKTTLIVNLLPRIQEQFECIIWQDLSKPKKFAEFWHDLTNTVYTGDIMPLIEYFKNHRCLLIFDNWEALLQSEHLAGHYEPEYQEYSDFFTKIAQTSHQSAVIIISQEKPIDVEVLSSKKLPVYSLELTGLNREELLQIFADQGLTQSPQQLTNLMKLYSYHPGVITLVAQDITEEFNGNISQYLSQSSLIVSDVIGNYIAQTFIKLSEAEINIIYLLSIVQEKLSQEQLKTIFASYLSGTDIFNSMKSLKRRSLLIQEPHHQETTYSLLPFIKKYVSNQFIDKICDNIITVIKTQHWSNIGLLRTHPLVYPDPIDNLINPKVLNRITHKLSLKSSQKLSPQLQDLLYKLEQNYPLNLGYLQRNITYLFEIINYGNRTNN